MGKKIRRILFIAGSILLLSGAVMLMGDFGDAALGVILYQNVPQELGLFQVVIERYLWADAWTLIFIPILISNLNFLVICLGAVCYIISRFVPVKEDVSIKENPVV